jgi:tRNA nucleotidyltransferase (CCA-adding enzyme)
VLYGVAERLEYHPEGDSGVHLEMALEQAWRVCLSAEERAAVTLHDIGKAVTGRAIENPTSLPISPIKYDQDGQIIPVHHGHDKIGAIMMEDAFLTLNLPMQWLPLSKTVASFHQSLHAIERFDPNAVIRFIRDICSSMPDRNMVEAVEAFARCVTADFNGRLGFESLPYRQGEIVVAAAHEVASFDAEAETRERIESEISAEKYHLFDKVKAEKPHLETYHIWRETMEKFRAMQASGEIQQPPEPLSVRVRDAVSNAWSDDSSAAKRRSLRP